MGIKVEDTEGVLTRDYLPKEDSDHVKVLELGVGGNKTVPWALGVDIIPKGEVIPSLGHHLVSVADIVADVTGDLPFKDGEFDYIVARHILEHCQDPIKTLREWARVGRSGAKLIIVVPNQEEGSTIPMNPEHLHSFTPDSMRSLAEAIGLKVIAQRDHYNFVSFITVMEKV